MKVIELRTKNKEKRKHRRIHPRELWVTEFRGDYKYTFPAQNLSEGGLFLNNRAKTKEGNSVIQIQVGSRLTEIQATPVHDQISKMGIGTGYAFINVSKRERQAMRATLRRLLAR